MMTNPTRWVFSLYQDDRHALAAWRKQLRTKKTAAQFVHGLWGRLDGFAVGGVKDWAVYAHGQLHRHVLTPLGNHAARLRQDVLKALGRFWPQTMPLPVRRTLQVLALGTVTAVAVAGTLVAKGASHRAPAEWRTALTRAQMLAIRTPDGLLLGGVAREANTPAQDLSAFGYINDTDALKQVPSTFSEMVVALEDRHHGSWRELCGVNLVSLPYAFFAGRGGSTLAMQLARDVERTGGESGWALLMRKGIEIGAAMRLGCTLGPDGVLQAYLARAPMVAFGGTTRGVVGAPDAVFGKPAQDLSLAQQAVLAASVLWQVTDSSRLPQALRDNGCVAIPETKEAALQAGLGMGWRHCRLMARAAVALRRTQPEGPSLHAALAELVTMERGINFANPWAPISTRRASNVSARALALLPAAAMAELRQRIDATPEGVTPTTSLVVSLNEDHVRFVRQAVPQALRTIESSNAGELCSSLVPQAQSAVLRCANTSSVMPAKVILLRANVLTGEFERVYSDTGDDLDRPTRLGSTAKTVVELAAAREGYSAQSTICPRSARSSKGGRALRRVTLPVHGFQTCTTQQRITLREAFATSDSLATYELARALGDTALHRALRDLGLPPVDLANGTLAYQLAFGVYAASPKHILEAVRRLASAAYGWPMHANELHYVRTEPAAQPAVALGLTRSQVQTLRALMEAPVQDQDASLAWASKWSIAGKSGTTSSTIAPAGARPYAAAKLTLLITRSKSVLLTVVSQPDPPFVLGGNALQGGVFAPLVATLSEPLPRQSIFTSN